jgi:chemosensory pili system protein ChpA (sensor histidine kinase/response regulator)
MFSALADPTRLAILTSLAIGGSGTVSEVAGCCPVDLSVVLRHLKILELALGAYRYQVETARDGHEALTLLQSLTPDVMIVDVEMPFMNGFELAKRVRRLRRFAHMPILVMTASEQADAKERMRECGVNRVIYRPVQGKSLDRVVSSLLRRDSAHDTHVPPGA